MFDTDIVSYLTKRPTDKLRNRYLNTAPGSYAISAINYAEIAFGLAALPSSHPMRLASRNFLETIQILDWPTEAASAYAAVRHQLRMQPIGDRDIMIAAHAIALDATLVTNNTRHFNRIGPPLRIENWLE